jgi:hypothetical protein
MRAEYDSEADALSIELRGIRSGDPVSGEGVDEDYCTVAMLDGRPVCVELLSPVNHLELLGQAAARYNLDAEALQAAAQSALAAPDRLVDVDVHDRAIA